MTKYQFVRVGKISLVNDDTFSIQLTLKGAEKWEKAVYIFVFNDKIQRIGSSKAPLGKRMRAWSRDVTKAVRKLKRIEDKKSPTPKEEARSWLKLLSRSNGQVYARVAMDVTTPIGTFKAYMDEESVLINRHKPPLNRNSNR